MEAAPCRPVLGPDALPIRPGPSSDELSAAVWWPPPRFALIGTAGVVELEKRRPVELLVVGWDGLVFVLGLMSWELYMWCGYSAANKGSEGGRV